MSTATLQQQAGELAQRLRTGAAGRMEVAAIHLVTGLPAEVWAGTDLAPYLITWQRADETPAARYWWHRLAVDLKYGRVNVTNPIRRTLMLACSLGGGEAVSLNDALAEHSAADQAAILAVLRYAMRSAR